MWNISETEFPDYADYSRLLVFWIVLNCIELNYMFNMYMNCNWMNARCFPLSSLAPLWLAPKIFRQRDDLSFAFHSIGLGQSVMISNDVEIEGALTKEGANRPEGQNVLNAKILSLHWLRWLWKRTYLVRLYLYPGAFRLLVCLHSSLSTCLCSERVILSLWNCKSWRQYKWHVSEVNERNFEGNV